MRNVAGIAKEEAWEAVHLIETGKAPELDGVAECLLCFWCVAV